MEKLTFVTDDNENVELYIIEETRANGVNYLLVTDSSDEEDTDAQCYILKDTSSEGSTEELFFYGNKGSGNVNYSNYTSSAGGETTGSASPVTSIGATGSGTAFSIMPPYLVVNIWKRLS